MKKSYLTTLNFVKFLKWHTTLIMLFLVFGISFNNYAQTAVDLWGTVSVPNVLDPRTATGGETLNFGAAPSTRIQDITVVGDLFVPVPTPTTYTVRRLDNAFTTGNDFDPWFREDDNGFNETANNYTAPYYGTVNDVINANSVDVGLDNTFNNSSSPETSNIERIDVVFDTPRTLRSIDLESGFPIFERGGTGGIKVAVITGVDGSGNPTSYSTVILSESAGYGPALTTNYRYDLLSKLEAATQYTLSDDGGNQSIRGVFFSWADFGLTPGTVIYGYSVADRDVPNTPAGFLDWATFPTNTPQGSGGADLVFNFQYFAPNNDIDGDGVPDYADLDNDNDGILDINEGVFTNQDSDGDGIFDYLDNDSDGDGCPDAIEAAGSFTTADLDSNNMLTGGVDSNNGVPLVAGSGQANTADVITIGPDTDGDGIADACDDTDNRLDSDGDGVIDLVDLDNDNDGIPDAIEQDCGFTTYAIDDFTPYWNFGTGLGADASGSATLKDVNFNMTFALNGGSKQFSSSNRHTAISTVHGGNSGSLLLSGPDESITFTFPNPITIVIGLDHVDANTEGWLFDTPADEVVSLLGSHEIVGSPGNVNGVKFIDNFNLPNITGVSYFKWVNITTLTITTTGPSTTTIGLNSIVSHCDTDNDGIFDYLDLDSDNDGITDLAEAGGVDADGDGLIDSFTDSDGDGLDDTLAANPLLVPDTDGDGVKDYCDLDSDNDGLTDIIEAGGTDADNDGLVDSFIDANNDGLDDTLAANPLLKPDSDNDGVPNYIDLDSDGDGINDITEAGGVDTDNDGKIDSFTDANSDGLDDIVAVNPLLNPDTDNDGIPNYIDLDSDNDGIPDSVEGSADFDNDGVPNYIDLDSDADGISDIIEAGGIDTNGDAIVDSFADANFNGIDDTLESTPLPVPNTDGTSGPDFLDIDADDDGIVDNIEGQTTLDYIAPSGIDADNDGIDDNYDGDNGNTTGTIDALGPNGAIEPTNTDGTDNPDYIDTDSDNDGLSDSIEGWDSNNDGTPNTGPIVTSADADGDGLDNVYDADDSNPDPTNGGTLPTDFPDHNGNGIPEWRDASNADWDGDEILDVSDSDSDNDGIPDIDESNGNDPYGDEDGDGIANWQDTTDDGNAGDGSTTDYTDADGNGVPDVYDTDGDGVPNHLDLDSDNDGIYDVVESGLLNDTTIADLNNDGVLDGNPADFGANGILDELETAPDSGVLVNPVADSDSDGIPDSNELDADADGCNDVLEAGYSDDDDDGILGNNAGFSVDANGLVNTLGLTTGYTEPDDLDNNNIYDFQQPGAGVPTTNLDPVSQTIVINANVSFSTDLLSLITYQWYESTDGGVTFNPITEAGIYSGTQTDILTITSVPQSYEGYQYQVIMSSPAFACDSDWTSVPAILTFFGDNDGDSIPDVSDSDSDNDGIPDIDESNGNDPYGDADGDGIPNWMDTTDDGTPGDGSTTDYTDADANGIPDVYDTDGDGVPNHLDLDSDNDGIYDVVESGLLNDTTIADLNNDGVLDGNPADFGANGILDELETAPDSGVLVNPVADSDGNGIPDSNELDADADGCNDVLEAGYSDDDDDGILGNNAGFSVDANGLVNTLGLTTGYTEPDDLDNNNIYDFQQPGAGVPTTNLDPVSQTIVINANVSFSTDLINLITYQWYESTDDGVTFNPITETGIYSGAQTDILTITNVPSSYNNNQYQVILSSPAFACDADWTSAPAILNLFPDQDGDGVPDFSDLDSDNDGIPDTDESNGNDPYGDADGDGIPNWQDNIDDGTPGDGSLTDFTDADGNGIPDVYDTDGDGVPNHLDLDSDNDGIYDLVESGQLDPAKNVFDDNNDGIIDAANDTTVGANGLFDALEDTPDSGNLISPTADSDNDGIIDSNDLNSDNDVDLDNNDCYDVIEAGFIDLDDNGLLGNGTFGAGLTVDINGLVTSGLGYAEPNDLDNNGIYDFQEEGFAVQPIQTQPQDQVIVVNANANFNVDLQNTITYQWQVSMDNGLNWSDFSNGGTQPAVTGANSEQLTLTMVPLAYNGYLYRVVLSSPAFACDVDITSLPALLTVYPDFDGDGVGDPVDLDSDNDGIPDVTEHNGLDPYADEDGDGIYAFLDQNDNNISLGAYPDGSVNPIYDFDGDGVPNHFDLDSDGDGVFDAVEAGLSDFDTNNDGVLDGDPADFGANGLLNALEDGNDTPTAVINYVPLESDGDGHLNFLDIDDDADGILTIVEGTSDFDGDDYPNYLDQDADGDGIPDNVEAQITIGYDAPLGTDANNDGLDDAYGPAGITPVDSDGDNDPDYLDEDSDNDNVPDSTEGHDFDADGKLIGDDIASSGTDSDNDGLDDAYDGSIGDFANPSGIYVTTDPENELPNRDKVLADISNYDTLVTNYSPEVDYRDTDDDGDGIPTIEEVDDVGGDPRDYDCDEDGTPNYLDATSCVNVPQGFSPNDDGENDTFVIPSLAKYKNFDMEVYDRWGNLVYEYSRNGDLQPEWWDGFSSGTMTISKSKKVPVGTYYYIINFNDGGVAPIAGWVYINY